MGEAKRKRLQGVGPVRVTPAVELDTAIETIEHLVETDQVDGWVQILKCRQVAPGLSPAKLFTIGIEKREAYDLICIMKKSMEDTLGFREDDR